MSETICQTIEARPSDNPLPTTYIRIDYRRDHRELIEQFIAEVKDAWLDRGFDLVSTHPHGLYDEEHDKITLYTESQSVRYHEQLHQIMAGIKPYVTPALGESFATAFEDTRFATDRKIEDKRQASKQAPHLYSRGLTTVSEGIIDPAFQDDLTVFNGLCGYTYEGSAWLKFLQNAPYVWHYDLFMEIQSNLGEQEAMDTILTKIGNTNHQNPIQTVIDSLAQSVGMETGRPSNPDFQTLGICPGHLTIQSKEETFLVRLLTSDQTTITTFNTAYRNHANHLKTAYGRLEKSQHDTLPPKKIQSEKNIKRRRNLRRRARKNKGRK